MSENYKLIFPKEYHAKIMAENIRSDDRAFLDIRELIINKGSILSADSSALVSLGSTKVLSVIKKDVLTNKPGDNLEEYIVLHVDVPNLCGFKQRNFNTQDFNRQLTNSFYEALKRSQCIQIDSFFMENMSYIVLHIDVLCLSYDGNIHDASMFAIITALIHLKLDKNFIELVKVPLSTSFSIIENKVLLDPNQDEELISSANIIITCSSFGNLISIKNADGNLSDKSLKDCISIAQSSAKKFLKILKALNQ